jgi:hypothetical protein
VRDLARQTADDACRGRRRKAAYEDFLRANADEYRRRSEQTTRLYVSEQALGRYERA